MAHIHQSVASLRLFGDSLVPDEISHLLGCEPTESYVKGQVIIGSVSKREFVKKTGMWCLDAPDREPEDLDGQITELLSQTTQQIEVWVGLAERFEVDLFCGLFMDSRNEGLDLSPSSLLALAERRIRIGLDIYAPEALGSREWKHIQVIDGAVNCVYDIFAITEEEFSLIFPEGQDVAFIDEVYERGNRRQLDAAFTNIWRRRTPKKDAVGIDGLLFYELDAKKSYYPTRRDEEAVNPNGSRLRA